MLSYQLVLLPADLLCERDADELLVPGVEVQPRVGGQLLPVHGQELQRQAARLAVLLVVARVLEGGGRRREVEARARAGKTKEGPSPLKGCHWPEGELKMEWHKKVGILFQL